MDYLESNSSIWFSLILTSIFNENGRKKTSAIKSAKKLKRKTRKRYNSEGKIAVVLASFK